MFFYLDVPITEKIPRESPRSVQPWLALSRLYVTHTNVLFNTSSGTCQPSVSGKSYRIFTLLHLVDFQWEAPQCTMMALPRPFSIACQVVAGAGAKELPCSTPLPAIPGSSGSRVEDVGSLQCHLYTCSIQ